MITTFFVTIGANFYSILIGLLPTGTLPAGVSSSIVTIVSSMYRFNALLPVDTLFTVLAASMVFEGAMILWDIIHWIIRKIPLVNMK